MVCLSTWDFTQAEVGRSQVWLLGVSMVLYGMIWHCVQKQGLVWLVAWLVWYDLVWYGVMWYEMTWYAKSNVCTWYVKAW